MPNLFQTFRALLPARPLQLATVTATSTDGQQATVQLPGGGRLAVRGTASVDDTVFVRDGVIECQAPSMLIVTGDI